MKADQNDIENLATLLTAAGCNYFMGIPHGDDVMLNYQTTGFRETAALREIFGLTAIPPFQDWLEKMGFVEIVTRQGVYVSDYRKTGSLDTLTALLNYNGGVMRDDEVRSLIEVRSANECLCVKLVVERATQAELDELAPMLDAIKDAKTDQEGAEATFQFHHALSVLSRNTFLPLLYNSIHSYGLHFWSLYRQRYGATACIRISSSSTARCSTATPSAHRRSPPICSTALPTARSRSIVIPIRRHTAYEKPQGPVGLCGF
mgnify:CR=1 FL=1